MPKEDDEAVVERRIAMEGRFVRIEGKIDALTQTAENDKATRKEVNRRLTNIEHRLYWAAGALAGIIFLANWIFKA